ncbi:MAG: hypothetical protein LCH41_04240 [Armatimonadetes bacterium]|nr:hypothetical protein [Armatimonadota bacterium]
MILIRERAIAQWAGDSGSCSNGLGSPITQNIDGGSSIGERVQAMENPGTQFSVSASPSAEATVKNQSPLGLLAATAGVSYSAQALRLKMVFEGSWLNISCIIGQQIRARVYVESIDTGLIASGWTVSNGDAFRSYTMSRESAQISNGWTVGNNSLTCAFLLPGLVTVSCEVEFEEYGLSALVSAPLGVETPEVREIAEPIGTTQMGFSNLDRTIRLGGANFGSRESEIFWSQKVAGYGGSWAYVQLIRPGRRRLTFGNLWQNCGHFQEWVLDGLLPYPGWSGEPQPWWATDGYLYFAADSPQNGVEGFQQVIIDEDFRTYTMYVPPPTSVGNSYQVVLRRLDWYWRGTASYDAHSSNYVLTNAGAGAWSAGLHQMQPQWSDFIWHTEFFP